MLFLGVISCGPFLLKIQETFWKGSGRTSVPAPNEQHIVILTYVESGLDFWCAASVLLAQASLSPSRWYWQCRQPDWTPSWHGARAHAPGCHSWSLQTRKPSSAASCTSGSLWVQYCHWWSTCSNDAILALVVLGRLSRLLKIYHHSLNCRHFCSNSSVERGFWIQSVIGGRHVAKRRRWNELLNKLNYYEIKSDPRMPIWRNVHLCRILRDMVHSIMWTKVVSFAASDGSFSLYLSLHTKGSLGQQLEWILARTIRYSSTDSFQKIFGSFSANGLAILRRNASMTGGASAICLDLPSVFLSGEDP